MAPPRIQVESGIQQGVTKAVASPVDTFAKPGTNILEQLAQGLGQISPEVRQFSQVYAAKKGEELQQEGEDAVSKLHLDGMTYGEATRKGLIPNHENPWFMAGFHEQYGRVMADKYQSDLSAAWQEKLKNGELGSMEDFDKFAVQKFDEWKKEALPPGASPAAFETGFAHRADAHFAAERRDFASSLAAHVDKQVDQVHYSEIKSHIQDSFAKGVDPAQIAADINQTNDAVRAQGRRGSLVNPATVRAVVDAAMENEDPKILDLLKSITGGGGIAGAISNTTYGSEQMTKARKAIYILAKEHQDAAVAEQNRTREATKRKNLGAAFTALAQDPAHHANLMQFAQEMSDAGASDGVNALVELQNNVAKLADKTNEPMKKELLAQIWAPDPDKAPVTEVLLADRARNGHLNATDLAELNSQLQHSREVFEKNDNRIFEDPNYRTELSGIKERFADLLGRFGGANADRAKHATARLEQAWYDLHSSGDAAKMSRDQRIQWLSGTADRLVIEFRGDDSFQLSPSPAANFPKAQPQTAAAKAPEYPKTFVLEEADLNAAGRGLITANVAKKARELGIPPPQLKDFVNSQSKLLGKKHKEAPAEE